MTPLHTALKSMPFLRRPRIRTGHGTRLTLLARYTRPYWRQAVLVALLLGLSILLRLLAPQVVRSFVDTALVGGALQAVGPAVALYATLAVAQQLVTVGVTYLTEDLGWSATNRLRADLALHCLRLDLRFHHQHTPGELIERVDGDVSRLAGFFSRFVVLVAGNMLFLLGVVVALWREDWRFGAGFAVTLLAGAAIYRVVLPIPVRFWEVQRQADADFVGFIEERLAGTEDVRANGATAYVMRTLYGVLRRLLERSRAAWLSIGALNLAWQSFRALGGVLLFGLGWWLLTRGTVSIGSVYLVGWYFALAIWPVATIDEQLEDLQKATASIWRIVHLLEERSALLSPGAPRALPAGPLSVAFEEVSFAYGPTGPLVLQALSFELAPGRTLGIAGRTGSGKSTVGRLLFRFYDPQAGSVRLGGVDLRDAPLDEVRRRVALVTQDVQLLQASLRDNLTLYGDRESDATILAALRDLGLESWYASLPHGLDTMLGPAGQSGAGSDAGDAGVQVGLSAGQAQLLALTRAFLRQPDVVILDEASSRLDPHSERLAQGAIDRLLAGPRGGGGDAGPGAAGRTAIVIAHRLSTLRRVDDVLILEAGRLVEHGPRAVLAVDAGSRLSELLRTGMEVLR
jgi:ATP-binding cassette subfamily B protein